MSAVKKETVAVLGASAKRDRYSNRAMHMLASKGHDVIAVNPAHAEVDGFRAVPNLRAIAEVVDTVTVYVRAELSDAVTDDLLALKPTRVIFNPGAENAVLSKTLQDAGIATEEACTLVLLSTEQF